MQEVGIRVRDAAGAAGETSSLLPGESSGKIPGTGLEMGR
jgi:hypothetical protein